MRIKSITPLVAAFVCAATATAALTDSDRVELQSFERKTVLAKRLGATHVPITDNLPPAQWLFQPADDPYPAWYLQRPDFLKLFPSPEVEPFVDRDYRERVVAILDERVKVLRKVGLKAHWGSNIPQVLPEPFFARYPHLRGPRVDQPNRSRTAHFSVCVDQPETLQLYAGALKRLLTRYPEIESFAFLTQDSGSGFCWVPALYPGLNGHSDCRERPMSDRIAGFLGALHGAAREVGSDVQLSLNPVTPRQWMRPSFSPEELSATLAKLPRGIAVQGKEAPDGRPFLALGTSDAYARGAFHPVVGLMVPDLRWLHSGRKANTPAREGPARRLIRLQGDEALLDFNARLHEAMAASAEGNVAERLAALRAFAASEAGAEHADTLLAVWLLLDDASRRLEALHFGDMLQFGHVLNRWVNRPMVPFPEELTADEKSTYRPFLFQAKGEEQAANLIDIQGMRMFEGYGARLLFQRVIETTVPDITTAITHVRRIRDAAREPAARQRWDLSVRRLEATECLLHTADHMVAYQAQLDRVKALAIRPEPNPPLGAESSWDRTDLLFIARKEVDNTVRLLRLLESTDAPLIDLAPVPEEETIMRLGPSLKEQLKRKIDIMNAHWTDYDRLFTAPNP